MIRSMSIAIAVAVLAGFLAAQVWGAAEGAGVGVLLIVIAAVVLVLRRNQSDLRDLEEGKVPGGPNEVLGDQEPR